jgi:RND family efflux transporter MFP subunit
VKICPNHRIIAWLAATLCATACGSEPPPSEIIRPVRAMQIAEVGALQERWFPGRASATQEANIAFEVAGRLVERPVSVGDRVTQGQLLAKLDPRDFQNALDQASAEAARARAFRDRIVEAAKTGAVARQDVDDAEAALRIAQAEVQIRRKSLADSELYAPFDGTVSAILVENFENVQAKQVIMRVLDTSRIEMVVNIPETLISHVLFVKEVRVQYDAFPDRDVPAQIKEVSNEASETTRTFAVNLIMDQPEEVTILPGMAGRATARVELPGGMDDTGFEVSASAVFSPDNENTYVWIVDPDKNTVSSREVEVGRVTPRGLIVKGVKPGEWVAIAGAKVLQEGQKVRILEQEGGG